MPASIRTSAIVVPRSGSIRISAQKSVVTIPIGLHSSPSVRGAPLRARYAAAQMSSAIFASSDGWNDAGPASSQRRAPLISGATTSTSAQSASAVSRSGGASSRSRRLSKRDAASISAKPATA